MSAVPLKQSVLGVGISATSYRRTAELTSHWVDEARAGTAPPRARMVTVTSVHGVVSAFFDRRFRAILNSADCSTPDGMPVVWAMRSFGVRGQQRVYGPTLTGHLCQSAAHRGHRIFLYGARPETLRALQARLEQTYPGIVICGAISPPFRPLTPAEDAEFMRQIRASRAEIVLVGLSTPKQELWMAAHREQLPGAVLFGVGAAFDFLAGRVSQAPAWMQRRGLEWFYRLTREPRRLWRRYLLITTVFPPLWALQKLGLLRYKSAGQSI